MQLGIVRSAALELSTSIGLMLSPRMLQMLKILNLPYSELAEKIKEQAEENPVLEIDRADAMVEYLRFDSSTPVKDRERPLSSEEKADLADYIKKGTNLEEHLLMQLGLEDVTEEESDIISLLIKNLDPNGYLNDYEEVRESICEETSAASAKVDSALELLQTFEPEGVGARSVKECLMIQVREYNFDSEQLKDVISRAVDRHLDDMSSKEFRKIAASLGITEEGAMQIAEFIRNNLDPYPGSRFSGASSPAVPSFLMRKEKGMYKAVNLEEQYGVTLKFNSKYLKMLEDPKTDEKTVSFLREKLNAAKIFLEQVEKRRKTMQMIADLIAEKQTDYFDGKTKFPLPVTQKEISDKFGIHPSTTSRAISEKYAETPRGDLKLKTLCPRNVKQTTKNEIKALVLDLINSEDGRNPLSDERLAEILAEKGIKLTSRAVTKYRKELSLEKAANRKPK